MGRIGGIGGIGGMGGTGGMKFDLCLKLKFHIGCQTT